MPKKLEYRCTNCKDVIEEIDDPQELKKLLR